MKKWNRRHNLKTTLELMQWQPIQIRRGIFYGESLLPLLFCRALIPLTHELNRAELRENKPLVLYGWLETAR